jgi:hypothetical protein
MSDEPKAEAQPEAALQFERADYSETSAEGLRCATCDAALRHTYFEVNGQTACESCRSAAEERDKRRPGLNGFLKALAAGVGAGAVGGGIYYAVLALTGYEFGLIAIVVGFMVGGAVRWATNGRGGRLYQGLAVFLTYLAIVSTYMPMLFEMAKEEESQTVVKAGPAAAGAAPATASAKTSAPAEEQVEMDLVESLFFFVLLFGFAAALPFLAGFENVLGLLIIGFGLYQAWKLNQRSAVQITGPYQVGGSLPSLPPLPQIPSTTA